jgi:hypothetical protein
MVSRTRGFSLSHPRPTDTRPVSTYENTGAEWAGPDWDAQPAKRPTHLRANSPSRLSVGSDPSSPALSAKSSPGMYDFTDTFNGMGISHERDTPRQDLYLGYNLDTEQAYTGAGVSVCENYGQGGRHDPYYLPVDTDYHGRARGNSAPPPIHPNGGHVPPFPLHPSHNHPNLNASHPDLLPIQYDGHHYLERANGGAIPAIVKSIVATENIKKAAAIRRTQAAIFLCPEPGCETTFTTNFKLQSESYTCSRSGNALANSLCLFKAT